jgi:putative ABC transport system substrate-binding protein
MWKAPAWDHFEGATLTLLPSGRVRIATGACSSGQGHRTTYAQIAIDRSSHLVNAFRQGLKEAGYSEGQNVAIEYRSAEGEYDRLPALAADLVRRQVTVIVATGGSAPALAAKAATSTIPIVFTGEDPVAIGLVGSLNQHGGNATGVSTLATEIGSKRVGILHELVPTATTIALLYNPARREAEGDLRDMQSAAHTLDRKIQMLKVANEGEIDAAFVALARERPGALLIGPDPFLTSRREQIVALANHYKFPALYHWREFGGRGPGELWTNTHRTLSPGRHLYGPDPQGCQTGRPAGNPVDEVRVGDQPQAAKRLGLELPPTLLARADEVIE